MNLDYRHTHTSVSMINYHFVFCPYKRDRIFDISGVEHRFKELVIKKCAELDIRIIAMECHHDHVHLFLNALPEHTIPDIMKAIKGSTSITLRAEFPILAKTKRLWTRSYFVSTAGNVSMDTIKKYIDTQKTRT